MKKIVTFEKVAEACKALDDEGKNISVRNIISITGGSTATVTPLLREYEQQQRREKELHYVMSESLRHALIDEMLRVTSEAKYDLETSLSAALAQESEVLAELSDAQNKNAELTEALETCRQQADQAGREAEKRLAASEQKNGDLYQQLKATLEENHQLQQTIAQLSSEKSKFSVQLSERSEQMKKVQDENQMLAQKCDDLMTRAHEQEKRADIAQSKCAYADERIAELKGELEIYRKKT